MTVYDNMAFGLKMRKFPKAEIATRVREAAQMLGIQELLNRKPRQLSGGQRQRVAVGRAIVRHPQVFLFDEPLSNLDAKLRVQMRVELKRLHDRLETTAIYVTHDQVEAMTLGDRVVVMKDGLVQQVGEPLSIYAKPRNRFVAGFIGSPAMNFLPVEADGRALRLKDGRKIGAASAAGFGALKEAAPKNIVLGIRPEHFNVVDGNADALAVTVELVEPLGSDTLIHFPLSDTPVIARVSPDLRLKPGDRIGLVPATGKAHLFAADTGEVIR
jgi:multiple sugar transport system ATP-binding protein